MNTAELLTTAADRLGDGTPFERAIAALLRHEAHFAGIRIGMWAETNQDVERLTEFHYGLLLAVARAAIAGQTTQAGVP